MKSASFPPPINVHEPRAFLLPSVGVGNRSLSHTMQLQELGLDGVPIIYSLVKNFITACMPFSPIASCLFNESF